MRATALLSDPSEIDASQLLLLVGDDAHLRSSVTEAVINRVLDGDEMGLEVFDARDTGTATLLDALASGGLFSPQRVVVYKNAQEWSVPAGSADLKELQRVVDGLDASTRLVVSADSINKGRYPFKYLVDAGIVVDCGRLKGGELKAWSRNLLNESGLTASEAVLDYALDLLGNDLLMIRNTLEKISLFMGDRAEINVEDVTACVATAREHAMWELTAVIGARNVKQALAITDRLLHEGKHPLQISATLQYQFRQLIAVRALLQQGKTGQQIGKELNIRFFVDRILSQARAFSPKELLNAYRRVYYLENSLKSASADERFILEKTIYDICSAA